MANIAVVYLARFAEGPEPVRRFIESYQRRPAGIAHDLVVVYKGFGRRLSGSQQKRLLDPVPHIAFEMSDTGFDLGSYRAVARNFGHRWICCLNTFTEIEADNWLQKLDAHTGSCGIAGATASLESLRDSSKEIVKAVWLATLGVPYDQELADRWGHEIVKHAPHWLARRPPSLYRRMRRIAHILLRRGPVLPPNPTRQQLDEAFDGLWVVRGAAYANMPRFPNPHIRTNGFIIEREAYLDFTPEVIRTKTDAFFIESGPDSLTARSERAGRPSIVVGNDGKAYGQSNWKFSDTFRRNGQTNKLFSDNQTRAYDEMSVVRKRLMETLSWGP